MLGGTSQGYDNGSDNIYINNFWNEWTAPDSEPNGIVDLPYSLDGLIGNADDFPLASPSGPVGYHYLRQFTVIHPNGGEIVNDSETIQWTASTDILSYEIEYTIYYSPDDGETWILIISELDAMQYEWNTTEVSKGNEFLIKVHAYCAVEPSISINDTSDGVFTLQGHSLTSPVVLSPNGGETINESIRVSWTAASDSWGHDVTYSVSYSSNGGGEWTEIVADLQNTYYDWNTTLLSEGSNYLIKVVAECSGGLLSEDVSDDAFTLQGHSLTSPVVLSPNGGEIIDESIRVSWTAASDSWGHDVTYSVSYSSNGGGEWTEIVADLQNTYYDWNTTLLSEGSNYLIKVVAECSGGLLSEDVSDDAFTIVRHILSQPTVTNPSAGETVSGIVAVVWTASIDSHAHNVNYTVFYSADGGESWIMIESGLLSTSVAWNTTELEDGSNYRIKIVATCSESLTTEFITGVFVIQNESTTLTDTSTTTTGTTGTTATGDDPMLLILGIAGIIGAVVVVVIIVAIRRGVFKKPTASP